MLRIYNSLTRRKEVFRAIDPPKVRLYVCGVTVYGDCHLGHARTMIAFDIVQRWLRNTGYEVIYVRNITDIDDKIIRRAHEENCSISSLAEKYIFRMEEDFAALGIEKPTYEPRVTQNIDKIICFIKELKKKRLAYQAQNGDVNYMVRKFSNYGKLSRKSIDMLRLGKRVKITAHKNDPLDFALWKSCEFAESAEFVWDSEWGKGRPGWHIECSAIAHAFLGDYFDIHGGGVDLQFPHHENEIAQSESLYEKNTVNIWMHSGLLEIDKRKMSKSLDNFLKISSILKMYHPEVLRFTLSRIHYRSSLCYSENSFEESHAGLIRFYRVIKDVQPDEFDLDWEEDHAKKFKAAMDDDFNTPVAVAVLFDLSHAANRHRSSRLSRQLLKLGRILGFLQEDPLIFLQIGLLVGLDFIERMISIRNSARLSADYVMADRVRRELLEKGVFLEDTPEGTFWRPIFVGSSLEKDVK